ncbi:MAG: ABC transporter permease subunit [Bacteroidota bacterium]
MTDADWGAIALSVRVATAATAAAALPSLALGWYLARKDGLVARLAEFVVGIPLVLPPVVTGYALLLALPRSITFTWWAGVIASSIVGLPLFVALARSGFASVSDDVLDAARTDGASGWRVFRDVAAPIAAPAVTAGAALHFARALGEFGATLVVAGNVPGRTQTLPLALYTKLQTPGGEQASVELAIIAVVLAVVSIGLSRIVLRRARVGPSAP